MTASLASFFSSTDHFGVLHDHHFPFDLCHLRHHRPDHLRLGLLDIEQPIDRPEPDALVSGAGIADASHCILLHQEERERSHRVDGDACRRLLGHGVLRDAQAHRRTSLRRLRLDRHHAQRHRDCHDDPLQHAGTDPTRTSLSHTRTYQPENPALVQAGFSYLKLKTCLITWFQFVLQ